MRIIASIIFFLSLQSLNVTGQLIDPETLLRDYSILSQLPDSLLNILNQEGFESISEWYEADFDNQTLNPQLSGIVKYDKNKRIEQIGYNFNKTKTGTTINYSYDQSGNVSIKYNEPFSHDFIEIGRIVESYNESFDSKGRPTSAEYILNHPSIDLLTIKYNYNITKLVQVSVIALFDTGEKNILKYRYYYE